MGKQLIPLFSFLAFIFCLSASAIAGLTPPKGGGGAVKCGTTTTNGATCNNGNCIDVKTGLPIPCANTTSSDLNLTVIVEQQASTAADFPTSIQIKVRVRNPFTNNVYITKTVNLTSDQIYDTYQLGVGRTVVELPYIALSPGQYIMEYDIISNFCTPGQSCDTYTVKTIDDLYIVWNYDQNAYSYLYLHDTTPTTTGGPSGGSGSGGSSGGSGSGGSGDGGMNPDISRIGQTQDIQEGFQSIFYPNPTATGQVKLQIEQIGQGASSVLYLRDELGRLLDVIHSDLKQGKNEIAVNLNRYPKSSKYIYQLILSSPSGQMNSKTGIILRE